MEQNSPKEPSFEIGNGPINAKLYGNLVDCDYSNCPEKGKFYKCYFNIFDQCSIYLKANLFRNFGEDADYFEEESSLDLGLEETLE
jgi:hypothetical protein